MTLRVREDPTDHFHIVIEGRFTFDIYREFLDKIDEFASTARGVTVDLRHSEYMDSSALGLLIQMRSKLPSSKTALKVRKGSMVDEVLAVANFDKLFAIEAT